MKNGIYKIVAQNKRARFDYDILEKFEAGIILQGSEVKSLRLGKVSLNEAHVGEMLQKGILSMYLFNTNIAKYSKSSYFNHEERRPRELLLRKREVAKLMGAIKRKGLTVVPLMLYFSRSGIVKVEIALARGRKTVDKRELLKERDWKKEQGRALKGKNREE
jgi:SsrA-binding protein